MTLNIMTITNNDSRILTLGVLTLRIMAISITAIT
jgi:hypothetical protein